MEIKDRDPHTGYLTTGHEWNGITELNTPVPRIIFFFLIATVLFAVGYWILMPAWPIGTTYTKGLLGIDQRSLVTESVKQAALDRATWSNRIEKESIADIQKDAALMKVVRETGRTLFGDNCAACHGTHATGGPGYPNLTTQSWLWGGTPEALAETIRVGINSTHPDTRTSQMPAFGRDGMLPRADIEKAVAYVRSLSHPDAKDLPADKVAAGKTIFEANCSSCHNENAKGNPEMGAPDLTDSSWIYGGDAAAIMTTVWGGRQGHMPTWENRLSNLDRRILVLYLLDRRGKS
jgi:cytochrome c oxidase cbb3-type subunit 3